MKVSYSVLEVAEENLLQLFLSNRNDPTEYNFHLKELCESCGWSIGEYWNHCLELIDAGWDSSSFYFFN